MFDIPSLYSRAVGLILGLDPEYPKVNAGMVISIDNLRSQLYSSVLYYTRISRHVSANSKPSSGVVAYRILKVSNLIKIV
jgi:hypothetical protein